MQPVIKLKSIISSQLVANGSSKRSFIFEKEFKRKTL